MSPRYLSDKIELEHALPPGDEERFNGFGIMGLPFSSGHILALRRFVASSVGSGYTSVWHRNPDSEWAFYANEAPWHSCTRYFGKQAAQAIVTPIAIKWLDDLSFGVSIEGADLYWSVTVEATPATRVMNMIGNMLPDSAWKNETILNMMSKVAGVALGVQKVGLSGFVPNGQHFIANLKTIWAVKESRASIAGVDFGEPAPLKEQANLADFWISQKGILAFGQAYFELFNPGKHPAATTRAAQGSAA
ncbi:hypothetical protein ACFS7Z_23530 [Pontibacter toksunensis]|uniref:Uncharacterized protein n=1 Tax=Pontibacter toksunensis TaxID=1332631 RepID=A0ABW6C2L1_9BACT